MTFLLRLARSAVNEAVSPAGLQQELRLECPTRLTEPRGCFVTLTADGALRGCMGNVMPRDALNRMIQANARSAALHDPRFTPVTAGELVCVTVEVSVLTTPVLQERTTPEDLTRRLVPHRDGVLLRIGSRAATFLPQVWAKLPEPRHFLDRLAEKAGCAPDAWRAPDVEVLIYQTQSLGEAA